MVILNSILEEKKNMKKDSYLNLTLQPISTINFNLKKLNDLNHLFKTKLVPVIFFLYFLIR